MNDKMMVRKKRIFLYFVFLTLAIASSSNSWAKNYDAKTLASFCSDYHMETQSFSLASIQPPSEVVKGILFPTSNRVLYRGALESNSQFNLPIVLRSILIDPAGYIGSPMFGFIKRYLMNQITLTYSLFSEDLKFSRQYTEFKNYLADRGILEEARVAQKCFYSALEKKTVTTLELSHLADVFAADLSDKSFKHLGAPQVAQLYINQANPSHHSAEWKIKGFGNNALDMIISSVYDQIAAHYGKKVLILKDEKRSVDLAYWNYKDHGKFVDHWVDNGEVNTPGYIRGINVMGFQVRDHERISNWLQTEPSNSIVYSFHRVKFKKEGSDAVLVFQGDSRKCITQGRDGRYYECTLPKTMMEIAPPLPEPASNTPSQRVPLAGVIVACDEGKSCARPESVFKWYGKLAVQDTADTGIKKDVALSCEAGICEGRKLEYFPAKTEDRVLGPQIESAELILPPFPLERALTEKAPEKAPEKAEGSADFIPQSVAIPATLVDAYRGNATSQASRYCNGKETCPYHVTHRYLGDPAPGVSKRFDVEWYCILADGSRSENKSLNAPADAEGKRLEINCNAGQKIKILQARFAPNPVTHATVAPRNEQVSIEKAVPLPPKNLKRIYKWLKAHQDLKLDIQRRWDSAEGRLKLEYKIPDEYLLAFKELAISNVGMKIKWVCSKQVKNDSKAGKEIVILNLSKDWMVPLECEVENEDLTEGAVNE